MSHNKILISNQGIKIPEVKVKGNAIKEIPEYNIFEYKEEEYSVELVLFHFNTEFLESVMGLYNSVGVPVDIEYHLNFIVNGKTIPHARNYNNKLVLFYTSREDCNKMVMSLYRKLGKTKEGKKLVKMSIDAKDWKMLYTVNKTEILAQGKR